MGRDDRRVVQQERRAPVADPGQVVGLGDQQVLVVQRRHLPVVEDERIRVAPVRREPPAVDDVRARVANAWPFEVDDSYLLVELSVEQAILGERAADEWPPRYTRWCIPTPS